MIESLNLVKDIDYSSQTILIVDDELYVRSILKKLLSEPNYNLVFATTGAETLTKAAELVPDLILLDVMMPSMDGFEVCRRLRADPALAKVPVVMLTALSDRESRLKGIQAGADDFMIKPFDHIELKTRVQTIIQLNRYRQLLTERTMFEQLIDSADEGYLIINRNGNILYANLKARLFLNLPADKNRPIQDKFLEIAQKQYHCEPENVWERWPNLVDNADIPCYLVRPESATSNVFWLQAHILDLPAGSQESIVVHLTDVTRQMTLRCDMQSFHAMVSHKLRTPLIGMLTGMELLDQQTKMLPSLSDGNNMTKFTQMALRGVKRFYSQVEDILQYITMSDLIGDKQGFYMQQLEPLVKKINAELEIYTITVVNQLKKDDLQIVLSEQAMELILWEILENSKKFHPKQKPTVEIKLSQLKPEQLTLSVSDNGLHLSPEQLAQVWTPYYQGEKWFTGEVKGMGLGLSMTAMIVWGTGGNCHFYNKETEAGVVVELNLPLVVK